MTATTSKRFLQPNEKTTIRVWMEAKRFVGQKSVGVWVTVGPHHISTARLTVNAFSRSDVVCNPGEVVFGSVAVGKTPGMTVTIEYAGPLEWKIHKVVVPKGAPFSATVKEQYRRPGEVGYQVKVSLDKDAAPGPFQERILLTTNDPKGNQLPLWVRGKIDGVVPKK